MFRVVALGVLLLFASAMPTLGQRSGLSPDLTVTIARIVPGRDGSVSVVVANQGRERTSRAQLTLIISADRRARPSM